MTSATDELRRLLDERGVEYDESAQGNTTFFRFDYCDSCGDYLHTIAITGACISAYSDYLTPEQAIAATLGNRTLTAEQVREAVEEHTHDFGNDWQAMADELNATLGSGECEITDNGTWGYPYVCSACDASFDADVNNGDFNYCPNCGRAVKR